MAGSVPDVWCVAAGLLRGRTRMKVFSEETKRRMSEAAKARCTPEWREAKSKALAVVLPLEKVSAMHLQGMTQQEIASHFGVSQKVIFGFLKRHGIPSKRKGKRFQSGQLNSNWKGDDATYSALHLRVQVARGTPSLCSHCGETEGRFEWANLTGNYQDVNDYDRLCCSCHKKLDSKRRKEVGHNTSKHVPRKKGLVS